MNRRTIRPNPALPAIHPLPALLAIHPLPALLAGGVLALLLLVAAVSAARAEGSATQLATTLTPVQDASITSARPDENLEGAGELTVAAVRDVAVIETASLIQFDLSKIPAGSTINSAALRLFQVGGSDGIVGVDILRETEKWDAQSLTWNSAPTGPVFATSGVLDDTFEDYQTISVQQLIHEWVNNRSQSPNFGLRLVMSAGQSRASRTFADMESSRPPELVIDYTPPPTAMEIPLGGYSGENGEINGFCDDKYSEGVSYTFPHRFGSTGTLYLLHTNKYLYICVEAPGYQGETAAFTLYLDRDGGREAVAEGDDIAIRVGVVDGAVSTAIGAGNGEYTDAPLPYSVEARGNRVPEVEGDGAEFQLPLPLPYATCGLPFGLALYHEIGDGSGEIYGFPGNESAARPQNWAAASLVDLACSVPPCTALGSPDAIPNPGYLPFDDLADGVEVGDAYRADYGIVFPSSEQTAARIYADRASDATKARSAPNVVANNATAGNSSANVPLRLEFTHPKSHVGFYMGNGETSNLYGALTAYDAAGKPICQLTRAIVPESPDLFMGIVDSAQRIQAVELDYGNVLNSEVVDDLYFAPQVAVQVCTEIADGDCVPATDAQVTRVSGGTTTTMAVGSDGYLLESGMLGPNDGFWAQRQVGEGEKYTDHRTSGPMPRSATPSNLDDDGVLRLELSHPLRLYNLTMTTQWDTSTDTTYQATLTDRIRRASDYLYEFSDGQFALGAVTVYQNFDNWPTYSAPNPAVDILLHADPNLRPKASPGGIVTTETLDPDSSPSDPDAVYYQPGYIQMGSQWNRFGMQQSDPSLAALLGNGALQASLGVSPTVTSLTDLANDWSLAFAHELGHYLLFQLDSYFRVVGQGTGNEQVENVYTCTGSAMSWVYNPINWGFVYNQTHWENQCGDTYANQLLQRDEWTTIRTWYNWAQRPGGLVVNPELPADLTQVNYVTPSVSSTPLSSGDTFNLNYAGAATASAEARGFTISGARFVDQGAPVTGSTQMTLVGPQAGDRFCVVDINENAAPANQRYHFGCEAIQDGDNDLTLRQDLTWAPVIEATPTSTRTWAISVTQVISGLNMLVRFYPENDTVVVEEPLTENAGRYVASVTLTETTPAAYVVVQVDETDLEENPARLALIDYGTKGGTVPGPAHIGDKAPVYSPDGQLEFYPETTTFLEEGHFVSVIRYLNTYPLPANALAAGLPYGLVSFPPSLTRNGIINIRFPVDFQAQVAAAGIDADAASPNLVLHRWDGNDWTPVETTVVTEPNGARLASGRSAGNGIYILLRLPDGPLLDQTLFLPLTER